MNDLYHAVNRMMAELGMKGQINTRHHLVDDVMDALHDIDGGVYQDGHVLVPVINCPHCDNVGWYMVPDTHTGEPMQEQCRFCYETPNSRFNVEALAMIKSQESK